MKLLLVAATDFELQYVLDGAKYVPGSKLQLWKSEQTEIDVLITGVGAVATTFHLTRLLNKTSYDLVIQAGIAGTFNTHLQPGDVVVVGSDRFAQLGADDDETFVDIFEMGLSNPNTFPFELGNLEPQLPALVHTFKFKTVKAISVETASGNQRNIDKLINLYHADIESMEGAAFYFCCMQMGIPCFQIRSISNYIEKRNKANWNIPLAVEQLNKSLQLIITNLSV